jgi:hypothetical protein
MYLNVDTICYDWDGFSQHRPGSAKLDYAYVFQHPSQSIIQQ